VGFGLLSVSPSASDPQDTPDGREAEDLCPVGLPNVDDRSLVAIGGEVDGEPAPAPPLLQEGGVHASGSASEVFPGSSSGGSHFRKFFNQVQSDQGLDSQDLEFLSHHVADSTASGYGFAFQKFRDFCVNREIDPLSCSPASVVKFLRSIYEAGASYSTVNFYRSAVSKLHLGVSGIPMGQHPLVSRAVKSVFRLRPPLPKYTTCYDVSKVLDYLVNLPADNELSLKQLTCKALFLTCFSSLSRVSTVSRLGTQVDKCGEYLIIPIIALEKQVGTMPWT
jgi:hypothetical protein